MPPIATTADVRSLLDADAPVAIGVSGGKDSCACALAVADHLDAIGHRGPRLLIHSDLGRVEWPDSQPTCERLAAATGLDLVVVRRAAGDMLHRWQTRWINNVRRYRDLSCVQLILPWSTPSMRFCTSELKTDVITRELVRRFPGQTIISASGIRREESAARAKAPIVKPQPKLTSKTYGTTGLDWHAILHWSLAEVLECCAFRRFPLHDAYSVHHSSRVSCVYCIMSSEADLMAAAGCADNHDVYREMVALEIASTFGFQGRRWLADVAPHLLDTGALKGLRRAKEAARIREAAEARIPRHLLYTAGWPTCVPTQAEAEVLCSVRIEVAEAVGLEIGYTDPADLIGRYEALYRARPIRSAAAGQLELFGEEAA